MACDAVVSSFGVAGEYQDTHIVFNVVGVVTYIHIVCTII